MKTPMSTLEGSAQLALDLAGGTTWIVERMHEKIAARANPLNRLMRALGEAELHSGNSTYRTIRQAKTLLQRGLRVGMRELRVGTAPSPGLNSPSKWQSALNGLCGDHLSASLNPLAITMHLHDGAHALHLNPEFLSEHLVNAGSDLVLMVHGWCLNHEYWLREPDSDLAEMLAQRLSVTPLYLNYNSGSHISHNGQALNRLLEELVAAWPVAVRSLSLIGHSMGGLVIRSACHYGEQSQAAWLEPLAKAIYLGSPHHGSAVAKGVHLLTNALRGSYYAEPLALGQYVSAGGQDLRYGNLLDEDWQDIKQDDLLQDRRTFVPLTPQAQHYFLAAAIGANEIRLSSLALGDLLVRLGSATGWHRAPPKTLAVEPEHCRILCGLDHFDLLEHRAARQQILDWLAD
jgi:pimeloyl-ACP methyl ester carboxylesterase